MRWGSKGSTVAAGMDIISRADALFARTKIAAIMIPDIPVRGKKRRISVPPNSGLVYSRRWLECRTNDSSMTPPFSQEPHVRTVQIVWFKHPHQRSGSNDLWKPFRLHFPSSLSELFPHNMKIRFYNGRNSLHFNKLWILLSGGGGL